MKNTGRISGINGAGITKQIQERSLDCISEVISSEITRRVLEGFPREIGEEHPEEPM